MEGETRIRYEAGQWKHCLCGCGGNEVRIGRLYYWMYNDHGKVLVFTGHRRQGDFVGFSTSFRNVDDVVRRHVKSVADRMRGELEQIEAFIASH